MVEATQEIEVSAKASRRKFTAEEKRRILQEAEACKERGELGALLRREGIYSSHLSAWRGAAAKRELAALAPAQVYATLLDEKRYLCSERTMYRVLAAHHEVRERRDQLRHPAYAAPELLATAPNQVWSWDITKLLGPAKWSYFYLYVIVDIFSRHVVGWMVAHRESAALARKLIEQSCQRQGITPGELTLHADRGPSMTSKPVALLLSDLGVTKTHSRPYVSNDNPFSEAQFKTMNYRPEFPERFASLQDS